MISSKIYRTGTAFLQTWILHLPVEAPVTTIWSVWMDVALSPCVSTFNKLLAVSYFYGLDHLSSTSVRQNLPGLSIVNPKDIDTPMIAPTDNHFPHFSKNTISHEPSTHIDFECSYWCRSIRQVEIEPISHVINENLSAWSANIDISAEKKSGLQSNIGNGGLTWLIWVVGCTSQLLFQCLCRN